MDTDFHSCGVDLASVLVWAIREQRLYSPDISDLMEFNIKLDGRSLGGKNGDTFIVMHNKPRMCFS